MGCPEDAGLGMDAEKRVNMEAGMKKPKTKKSKSPAGERKVIRWKSHPATAARLAPRMSALRGW